MFATNCRSGGMRPIRMFAVPASKQARLSTASNDLPESTGCSPGAILPVGATTGAAALVRAARIFKHLGALVTKTSLILGLSACEAQQSSVETDTNGVAWHAVIASDEDTPDLQDASAELYIPNDVDEVRGVLVFSHAGVGESEYQNDTWRSSDAPWRARYPKARKRAIGSA
jgi:hypothetical protein